MADTKIKDKKATVTLEFSGFPKAASPRNLFGVLNKVVGKERALNRVTIKDGICVAEFPADHGRKILDLKLLNICDSDIFVKEVSKQEAGELLENKKTREKTEVLTFSNIPQGAKLKHLFYMLNSVNDGPLNLRNKVVIENGSCKVIVPRREALKIYTREKKLLLFDTQLVVKKSGHQASNVKKKKASSKKPGAKKPIVKEQGQDSSPEIKVEVRNIPKSASAKNVLGAIRKQYGDFPKQTELVKIKDGTCILTFTEEDLTKILDMEITVFDHELEFTIPQKKEWLFTLQIPDTMDVTELCSHVQSFGLIVKRKTEHMIEVESPEEALFKKMMSDHLHLKLNQHILPLDVYEFNKKLNIKSGSKCVVFWDFENCGLGDNPRLKSIVKYVNLLRTAINCVCGYALKEISIKAIGNTSLLSNTQRQVFDRQNITSLDVPQQKKEAADKRILTEICLDMCDAIASGDRPVLVLISGDADFNGCVTKLRMREHLAGLIICAESRISAADYHDPTNIDCFMRHEKLWEYSCMQT